MSSTGDISMSTRRGGAGGDGGSRTRGPYQDSASGASDGCDRSRSSGMCGAGQRPAPMMAVKPACWSAAASSAVRVTSPPSVVQPPSFSRSEKHEDRETRVWICGRPSLSRHVDHSTFLDADCEFIGVTRATRASYLEQSTCAVAVVTRLLDRLRVLGVYDDSVIVISSDHGVRLTPEEFVYDEPLPFGDLPAVAGNSRALLAVKTANADGPLRISYAPTAITDIPVTIMDAQTDRPSCL